MLRFLCNKGYQFSNLNSVFKRFGHSSVSSYLHKMAGEYKVGQHIHGYELKRIEDIPELFARAYFLVHEKTKAQHLHIWRDDPDNFMGIYFRTVPYDSSGVAHVLEHIVTTGSERFPVRDIFMKMTSRSLATFMNAQTWPDSTAYPFSSANSKDLENLMKTYLDFTFFPSLSEVMFRQEAWRVEHEIPKDSSSPFQLKGVVLNEMKGHYSCISGLYYDQAKNALFPDNCYSFSCGGYPLVIPSLTYQGMKNFYKKHYHPSNSRFFTYGNSPFEKHLELINSWALSRFDHDPNIAQASIVPLQKPWTSPRTKIGYCRPDPMAPFPDKQTTASMSYLLPDISNGYDTFVLSVISNLLTSGQNAEFYESLIGSGIGMDFSSNTGYSKQQRQTYFGVGLEGINEKDVEKLKGLITSTFEKVAEVGFPQQRIEAVLHNIELGLKHQKSLFGLHLYYNTLQVFNHDGDPIESLKINSHVERFRKEMDADPKYLQKKIQQYFIDNSHCLFYIMKPSDEYCEKEKQEEQKIIDEKVKEIGKETIFKQGIELSEHQSKKDDVSVLPNLDVATDIPTEIPKTPLIHHKLHHIPLQMSPQPTNGVVYFKSLISFPKNAPKELKPYWSIFCSLMTKLGAGSRTYKEMDQEIKLKTGGLSASSHIRDDLDDLHKYDISLLISSKCLEKNTDAMFDLWKEIFNKLRYDEEEHISQLIKIMAAEESSCLSSSGHSYVLGRACSTLKAASNFREITEGLSYAMFLKNIAEKNDMKGLIDKLIQIAKIVFTKENMKIFVNGEPSIVDHLQGRVEHFINNLSSGEDIKLDEEEPQNYPIQPKHTKEHFVFPLSTNFVSKAILCVPYNHPDHAKIRVLTAYISNRYLLEEIREKGGAYGCRASISSSGILSIFTYRDPDILRSINIIDNMADWISKHINQDDLNEAKLSIFQSIDKPITPEQKGTRQFLDGITDEIFEEYRRRVLNTTQEDLLAVAKKYLTDNPHQRIASIGPENEKIAENNDWNVINNLDNTVAA